MSSKRASLAERMRERRKAMQDTQEETMQSTGGTVDGGSTWGAAMEMTNTHHQPGVKMMEDVEKAPGLVRDLEARRNERKKELHKTLRTTDDVSAEIRTARRKSRQKVQGEVESGELMVDAEIVDEDGEGGQPLIDDRRRESKALVNAALREKLRSKVQSAKKSDTDMKEDSQPQRTLRGKRDKPLAMTRFDESLAGRDETEEQLERSLEMKNKWKKASDKAKSELMPSREEQFDFFTNTWDDEGEEEEKRTSAVKAGLKLDSQRRQSTSAAAEDADQKDQPAEEDKENKEIEEKAAERLARLADEHEGSVWFMAGAEYVPSQKKIEDEEQVYWVPPVTAVPAEQKIQPDTEPRHLVEEGFYVGRKPLVTSKERNKMENRLLHEPDNVGKAWFGEDGQILSLPDPVKETPFRPMIAEETEPMLQTFYRKAIAKEFDSRYIDGSIESDGQYRLEIDVNTLSFTHHDLMSREHVLCSRLTVLAEQYQERHKLKIVDYLTEKIKALKTAILHLQETLLNYKDMDAEAGDGSYHQNLKSRLKDYVSELRDMRKSCDAEELSDRELLRSITKTWTSLKHLREFQGCVNTPIKLNFQKIETKKSEDKARLKAEITEEVDEMRIDHNQQYEESMATYKESLHRYKEQQRAKKEATLRLKKRKRQSEEGTDDLLAVEQDTRDQAMLDLPDLAKPEVPKRFDEKTCRDEIEEKYKRIKRRPGEPILIPEISQAQNVTSSLHCPQGEQARRVAVQNCRLYAKIYFNGKQVARTEARQLTQDFSVSFAKILPINIVQWPDSINIEIYECGTLRDRMLAKVYAAIPATNVTSESAELDSLEFASEITRSHQHEGVGAGVPITFDEEGSALQTMSLLISGSLLCSVAWGVDSLGNPLVPITQTSNTASSIMKSKDAVAAIGATAMVDIEKLTKWISESRIDPNDPANAELVYLLRPMGGGDKISGPDYFRLEQLQEEFNFTTDEEIAADKRLKILEMREKEIPEFRNMKMVPAFADEISYDVFKEYNKRLEEENKISAQEGDSHRAIVTRFMHRVREQVLARRMVAAHQKSLQEIVVEDSVPNIAGIVLNVSKVLAPRRQLRPKRKERKKVAGQNLQDREVKIMVNITRAYDVPCRVQESAASGASSSWAENTARVRPFLEVMFQRKKQITSVAEGPNPSWNEELNLPFRAPNNDYSATNLQTVNDSVYINMFDEVVIDVPQDDRDRGRIVHKRLEKKWLGGIQIPFATLYSNGVIEGTFKLDSPAVLLGYAREVGKKSSGGSSMFDVGIGKSEHTYVSLFMTIEPPLGIAPEIKEQFESNESEQLLENAGKFMDQVEKKYPNRPYLTAVMDINGKTVFVTKYFKALSPPESVLELEGDKEMNVARYVSMIPYISDSVTFPGMCDIWSTCDQFLQMLTGDEEEHAVLLTNYFLHMGKDAYLCVGMAIPEGITAYTVVKEGNQTWIWNAMKGEKYSYNDTFCPLISVGCLINQNNIWANINASDRPNRMTWDIHNNKCWKPFFHQGFPNPGLPTVQPEQLLYFETDKNYVYEIQEKLEKTLKDRFEKQWRPRNITRWNLHYTQTFRKLLATLEMSRGKQVNQEHRQELEGLLKSYKLSGFTLNLPFIDVEPAVDTVYATGVWENHNPGIEFALAVHVHPYPNSVLSVWIYVASLQRL